jgi:hypothetical protein
MGRAREGSGSDAITAGWWGGARLQRELGLLREFCFKPGEALAEGVIRQRRILKCGRAVAARRSECGAAML